MSIENNALFGPALPPGFKLQNDPSDSGTDVSSDSIKASEGTLSRGGAYGPVVPASFLIGDSDNNSQSLSCVSDDSLPPSADDSKDVSPKSKHAHSFKVDTGSEERRSHSNIIGPSLPPGFTPSTDSDTPEDHFYGPALPPGFQTSSTESRTSEPTLIGPVLPPHLRNGEVHPAKRKGKFCGPALPPGCDKKYDDVTDSEDEEIVGPLPSEAVDRDAQFDFAADFEKRSNKMKEHLLSQSHSKKNELKREEWMMEMPDTFGHRLGLKSKGFSHSRAPKVTKPEEKKPTDEIARKHLAAKEEQVAKQLEEYNNQKRPKSLLEIHQENRKKQKVKPAEKEERRPFDRDSDLQIQRMDPKQTKSVLDKAKLVNSRFSHGASHYL